MSRGPGRRSRLREALLSVIGAGLLIGWSGSSPAGAQGGRTIAHVVEVVDGDTIVVSIGGPTERVRLIGIDAPEIKHPGKPIQCFGPEAAARLSELAAGQVVELELDDQPRDQYARLLAYVWLGPSELLNLRLAAEGDALALTIAPNLRYADQLETAAAAARVRKLGLWGRCPPPEPATVIEPTLEDLPERT